ncbi:unnamed protein product [Zymoseptoria tritici ST99CH_3D1]|nr:unnamed protein product [Zymoseptoria tritici ST99CH_3D1]
MAPLATEDYYLLLGVEHTATLDEITKSYRRLSLKLHPDRNKQPNATSEFQRLGLAHETLRDPTLRREYNELYPSLKGKGVFYALNREMRAVWVEQEQSPATTEERRPSELLNNKLRLEVLRELRRRRILGLEQAFNALKRRINDHKKDIRTLERQIRKLQQARLAEDAPGPPNNKASRFGKSRTDRAVREASGGRKVDLDEEEELRREVKRQEMRIEQDMKERRLQAKQAELSEEADEYEQKWREFQAAHAKDGREIAVLRSKVKTGQEVEDRDRAKAEIAENKAKVERDILQREQERMKREELQHEKERLQTELKEQEATNAIWATSCRHEGLLLKFLGKRQCPGCRKQRKYLLECSKCWMRVCQACWSTIERKARASSFFG